MKKILLFVLSLSFIIIVGNPCYAIVSEEPEQMVQYTYLEDGGYFVTVISDGDEAVLSRSTSTVTKSKTATYYNKNNEAMWYVKVTGTFTYGNGSAKCTSSSVSAGSYVNSWKVSDKSASKSGASATAKAVAKHYQNGVAIDTANKTVTLTCDSKGNFS